eukprot:gnl/TRDRNA2_/TRDRNA2_142511_c0_seq1.p1 gnl/TRDRNA2_/TRDRNA2_142511_c0~~gnl/TRDRNA2_/TRDRNA2_142511_c0_seq1.p1  ORF type:complete len:176 (-),score=35.13 gnl/TRDRNA2_/TRDRNA2_142511_c0_seq1:35-562(-)
MIEVSAENEVAGAVLFIFIMISACTIMNLLIGVLVDGVATVAKVEKEEMVVGYVTSKLKDMRGEFHLNTDHITRDEFVEMLHHKDVIATLRDVGVDVLALVDFADFIFNDELNDETQTTTEKVLDFQKFMQVILRFRGDNTPTMRDIVDLRKFIKNCVDHHYDRMRSSRLLPNVL